MKNFFVMLIALIGFGIGVNAQDYQSCKVSGTEKGTVQISISSYDAEEGSVTIDWSNDTDVLVNVSFKIKWILPTGGTDAEKTFSFQAKREDGGSKIFYFNQKISTKSYPTVIDLKGAKCN